MYTHTVPGFVCEGTLTLFPYFVTNTFTHTVFPQLVLETDGVNVHSVLSPMTAGTQHAKTNITQHAIDQSSRIHPHILFSPICVGDKWSTCPQCVIPRDSWDTAR